MTIKQEKLEKIVFVFLLLFIILNAFRCHDSVQALISAVCGITYTVFAGKGYPLCYLFGVTGSSFYAYISAQNALWGNVFLYLGYYVPMQILGFWQWRKHLKQDKNEIVKTSLKLKEFFIIILCSVVLVIILAAFLGTTADKHPILDSMTTIFSISGMYLTVRRCIEQWLFWMIVNALSLLMWLNIALQGGRVYSTVIMWAVYLFLAFYFYSQWRREIK